jgi:hypothetical protein
MNSLNLLQTVVVIAPAAIEVKILPQYLSVPSVKAAIAIANVSPLGI